MSHIYNDLGYYKKSIAVFKKALKKNPDDCTILCSLALSYEDIGNYHEAIKFVSKALRIRPTDNRFKKILEDLERWLNVDK